VIVADANIVAVALLDAGENGDLARERLRGERLVAPALIDVEVLSIWRGLVRGGRASAARIEQALDELRDLPLRRADDRPLVHRCWELRDNVAAYDAVYVALAEALAVPLVTSDVRLSRASGPRCEVQVLQIGR
jgi:predicted nucleic acid-binding protein